MEISVYLAKIIGPLFIIISISMITNLNHYKVMMKKIGENPLLMYLSGFFAYIIGMLIILNHNIWALNCFVLITIIGWISVIKGASLILFPNFTLHYVNKIKITKGILSFIGIIWLIIGFTLTYLGFFVTINRVKKHKNNPIFWDYFLA